MLRICFTKEKNGGCPSANQKSREEKLQNDSYAARGCEAPEEQFPGKRTQKERFTRMFHIRRARKNWEYDKGK